MAFNFNWSPLMADAGFYTRAQDLLTAALNKSPKPPIIVDDIIVTELNLGSIPPELEILEIGDLAEDRFRGIFKMVYSGDAYLTLKTRVQANPLNTYLVTRPAFASPQPLAAATGLTIPLQITLSEIKLSAFIVLVFSKQKGITLVFRNDPLQSLKVSSTFDSIPFVRDFLQREIEGQLRLLFMDELPAIIHRLSLRLWVPEYRARDDRELAQDDNLTDGPAQDPLASPPQDPVDASEIASLSLDSGVETHSLFSQKNLLRLAALTDSQQTLSLFTPSIEQTVFRAWTGPAEQSDNVGGLGSPMSPALSRTHSHVGGSVYSFQDSASAASAYSRPSLHSSGSSAYNLSLGSGRHPKSHAGRKRKKRVVDLRRRNKPVDDTASVSEESMMSATESTSVSSAFSQIPDIPEEKTDDPVTPPMSPQQTVRRPTIQERRRMSHSSPQQGTRGAVRRNLPADFHREQATAGPSHEGAADRRETNTASLRAADLEATPKAPIHLECSAPIAEKSDAGPSARGPLPTMLPFIDPTHRGILEQAWMLKMAGEIARRMQDEKSELYHAQHDAPPAYGQ